MRMAWLLANWPTGGGRVLAPVPAGEVSPGGSSWWPRWWGSALGPLRGLSRSLPHQPGYNKRLRAALPLVKQVIRDLAADSDFWFDNVWIADSTPVECGRSRPTVKRSDLAGWAGYGYCASHSRWFWGLRLYLICTPAGMPALWALAAPIWHNNKTGAPVTRSLIAYDH